MTTANPPIIEYLDLFSDAPEGPVKFRTIQRIVFFVALLWVPPVILSDTMLTDLSFHIRCLLAIPILIASEGYVQLRIGDVIAIIRERVYLTEEGEKKTHFHSRQTKYSS